MLRRFLSYLLALIFAISPFETTIRQAQHADLMVAANSAKVEHAVKIRQAEISVDLAKAKAATRVLFPIGGVDNQPYRFATNRTHTPFAAPAVTAGHEYQASSNRFYTPNYAQNDFLVCVPNYYTPTSSTGPWEIALDAGRVIEGVTIQVGSTLYPMVAITDGQTSHTFTTDPYVWYRAQSATVAANTAIDVIVADYVPTGLRRPASYNPTQGKYGGGYVNGATTQAAYLTTGNVPAPPGAGPTNTGPCAIVAKGALPLQPVPLVVGMSITDGTATNAYNQLGPRANAGYVAAGFDDDTPGVGRFAFGMFAVGATGWQSLTSTNFAIRKQLLADVGYPFNVIYGEYGQNDTDAGFGILFQRANTGLAFVKTLGTPARRVVWGGINPLTSDATTNLWTLPSATTVSTNNATPNGVRWQYQAYMGGTSPYSSIPANEDAYLNLTSYFVDPTLTDRWTTMGRDGTLAADVSSGAVILVNGTCPIAGDDIVIGAGAAGAIIRNVGLVTGSSPCTVTFSADQAAISTSFLTGRAVKATGTPDGIHPAGTLHAQISQGIIAAKSAGLFYPLPSAAPIVPVPVQPSSVPDLVGWYKPSAGGMFQSNAGTTPAVANGDLVGLLPDQSSNGFTLTSIADNATRPVLQGVGTNPHLSYVVANSNILVRNAAIGGYAAGGATWIACMSLTAGAVNQYFAGERNSASGNALYNIFNALNTTDTSAFIRNNAAATIFTNGTVVSTNAFPTPSTVVVYASVDNGSSITPYVNGTVGVAKNYTRSGVLTLNRFGLGGLYAATPGSYMGMDLYEATLYNRALTSTEVVNLTAYMATGCL